MKTTIAPEVQRFDAAERWLVRRLRLLLDSADEHLHAWEVLLRAPAEPLDSPAAHNSAAAVPAQARRSTCETTALGLHTAAADRKPRRRRHVTSREFDLRFAR